MQFCCQNSKLRLNINNPLKFMNKILVAEKYF
jgi:hypothetical protein